MSCKWNENSTLAFLNAYRKHPCLWNPNHVKYYDCLAKNAALRNVIKELNAPGLNISDCLEQIKVIREKYGQEQSRIIKALHSLKPYKPTLVWFPVMSEMLAKIISDEGKLQNMRRPTKTASPSPGVPKERAITTPYDRYQTLEFPCARNKAAAAYSLKSEEKRHQRGRTKSHGVDTGLIKTAHVGPDELLNDTGKRSMPLNALQCPSCGWEDTKQADRLGRRTRERAEPSSGATIPLPGYRDLGKSCEGYNNRMIETDTYDRRHVVPCPSFPPDNSLIVHPSYPSYCTNILAGYSTSQPRHIDTDQPARLIMPKPQLCARAHERQFESNERSSPMKSTTTHVGTSVGCRDQAVQSTVCVSRAGAAPPCAPNVLRDERASHFAELDDESAAPGCCGQVRGEPSAKAEPRRLVAVAASSKAKNDEKEVVSRVDDIDGLPLSAALPLSKVLPSRRDLGTQCNAKQLREVAVDATIDLELCDRGMQHRVAVLEKTTSTTREEGLGRVDCEVSDTVTCPGRDVQDVVGIRLRATEESKPDLILITVDGKYAPLRCVDARLGRPERMDEGERDETEQREVQEACCALGERKDETGNGAPVITETCSRDTMEIVKHNSAVTQALLRCLKKMIRSQEESSAGSNSSETTICEPCRLADETTTNFAATSGIKPASPSCSPYVEETERADVTGTLTRTFLELIKHALTLNSKRCMRNDGRISKEDAVEMFVFLNKMKECADNILRIHVIASCLKKRPSSEELSCPRRKGKCPPWTRWARTEFPGNGAEQHESPGITYVNSGEDAESVSHGLATSGIMDHQDMITKTAEAEKAAASKAKDDEEEVLSDLESVTGGRRDLGTHYSAKQLREVAVDATEHHRIPTGEMSVATRNREPILLRVIKRYNKTDGGGNRILKLDKETCVRDAHHVAWWTKRAEKYVETYPRLRSRLSSNTYRKYLMGGSYNGELAYPGVSQTRERLVNRIDYRTLSNRNRTFRGSSSPLELSMNGRVSRIPLYARPRKYVRRRDDSYRLSQSYA